MIFESEGNCPLEQITKCFGEFSIIVKFVQLPSHALGIFSFSLKPCSIPNTQITGGSPWLTVNFIADCHTLSSVPTKLFHCHQANMLVI